MSDLSVRHWVLFGGVGLVALSGFIALVRADAGWVALAAGVCLVFLAVLSTPDEDDPQ